MQVACPQCGNELPGGRWRPTLTCPACGLRFGNPTYGDLPPAFDQVRRDRRRANGAFLTLGVLGVIGALSLGSLSPAFLLVAALGVFGFSVWCSDRPLATHPVVKILVGLFAVAGIVVLLGGAVLVFLFIQCATGGMRLG